MDATPRLVLLFSGHRVDAPDRAVPRFPAKAVEQARQCIVRVLDQLGADSRDLGMTQGAAGGDLLFAEACIERRIRVELMLPLPESEFVRRSVETSADGQAWAARYRTVRSRLDAEPRILSPIPEAPGDEVFERCNRWLLDTALGLGGHRLRFICLWDGQDADGAGGTRHLLEEVLRAGGHSVWIDSRTWQIRGEVDIIRIMRHHL